MARLPKPPRPHTIIYASDLMTMMGGIHKAPLAYHVLRELRLYYGKLPGSDVTVEEFCEYMGHRKYEVQHIIDCIRRDEELAYYSKVENRPRNVLAVVEMREEDTFVNWN